MPENTVRHERLKKLYRVIERYMLPLLLGAVVMDLIFKTYILFYQRAYTAVFVADEVLLFFIFEKLKPKKIIRFFLYLLLGFGHLVLSGYLIMAGWQATGVSFSDWFYLNTQDVGAVTQYEFFLVTGIGFFIVSVLYYFTCYRYRIFGVMLITLFPFVIYGKRDDVIPTLTLTLMMTVFLAMMVHQRLVTDETRKGDLIINPSYVIGAALFISFAGAVTMVLPKPYYRSELEEGTGIFRFDYNSNTTGYDDLSDVSSPRFGADATGEILFRMTANTDNLPVYIRRQSFDVFRNDRWELDRSYNTYYGVENGGDNEVNSPRYVYGLMKDLADTGNYADLGLEASKFGAHGEFEETVWLNLQSSTYSPSYVPAPLMARVDALNYCERNVHGEVNYASWVNTRYRGLGLSYSFFEEDGSEFEYIQGLGLTPERFKRILALAYAGGDITPEQYSNFNRIESLYTDTTGVSAEVEALAHQITDGYTYDHEKAAAIVNYFVEEGYIYDLDYEPEDESIEFFLFNSKTGICTSYATAMTLMARAVGLPARYVEGFIAYERNADNTAFVIRDSHAHAFVECYIAGIGWVTFDPTVPGYMDINFNGTDEDGGQGGNAELIRTFFDYLSRIILFLGVVFVLVFIIFLDRIIEMFFRLGLKFRKTDESRIHALYKRILRLLELSSHRKDNIRGHTPHELAALANKRGADIDKAAALFEASCFGGIAPTGEEYAAAYSDYKQSWRVLAGKKPKKKKQK